MVLIQTYDARAYDIEFPGIPLRLSLLRDRETRAVRGGYGPAEAGEELIRFRDVPYTWRNRGRGMGVSQFDEDIGNDGDYAYGINIYARVPGSWMPSGLLTSVVITSVSGLTGAGPCTSSFIYSNDLFFVFGRYVVKIAAGTDSGPIGAAERDLGVGFTGDGAALFDNVAYVGGTGGNIWRYNGGWSQSVSSAFTKFAAVYWITADGVGAYRLVGTDTTTSIRHIPSGSDPMTFANWSAQYKIASGNYPINSLVAANQHVWACTAGGVADLDARGYSPILNPYFAQQYDAAINGSASMYHDGYVYVAHLQGLDRLDVSSAIRHDQPSFCQPGVGSSNETPIYGRCTALVAEGGFILASIYNGTDSYLMAGKPDPGVIGGVRWTGAELKLSGERITHMRVHSTSPSNNPCVWIASVSGATPKLYYLSIPKAATAQQELLNNLDSNNNYTGTHRWAATSQLFLGNNTWGDGNNRKVLLRYDAYAERLNSTATYARVYAQAEGGTWVQQGTGGDPKLQTSPRSQLIPVAPLVTGYNVGLRIDITGTTTQPAILREFKARAEVIQELRDTRQYRVILGTARTLRNGSIDQRDPAALWAQLNALQTREPLDFIDEMGQSLKVRVEPGMTYQELALKRDGGAGELRMLVADVTISVVPTTEEQLSSGTTVTPIVYPGMVWDGLPGWDGASWGP